MSRSRTAARTLFVAVLAVLLVAVPTDSLVAGRASEVRTRSFELLNRGVSAYNRGDFTAAVEALQESASMALNSFRAHYYLGLALIGARRYGDSLEPLDVALELDPTHLRALVALGDAHLKMGDVSEARAAYFRAVKLRPAFAPALDGLARCYESQAADERAIKQYRAAIASNKGFAPAYTHLGDLYLRQDRLEEAVLLLEEAVSIRPDYAPGMNRLALAYGRLGMDNEAVALITKAIELEPLNPSHLVTLGELQLGQSQIQAAERSFRQALELDDGVPEARKGLAELARRRGDYATAIETIDTALKDSRVPADVAKRLREYRASLEQERAEFDALLARTASGEATPGDHLALARIHAGRDSWEIAVEHLQYLADDPTHRNALAYALFRVGRFRDASAIYGELAGDDDPEARLNHGVTLARLGDEAGAIDAFASALKRDPDHRAAHLYLGNALLRSGRADEAARSYRRFLDLGRAGEDAERVRRILKQIAPEMLPEPPPPPPPPPGAEQEDAEKEPTP